MICRRRCCSILSRMNTASFNRCVMLLCLVAIVVRKPSAVFVVVVAVQIVESSGFS